MYKEVPKRIAEMYKKQKPDYVTKDGAKIYYGQKRRTSDGQRIQNTYSHMYRTGLHPDTYCMEADRKS